MSTVKLATAGVLLLLMGYGCTAPAPSGPITSPNPEVKIPAMKRAVADKDKDWKTIRELIKDLENDDPAIRFYAIYTLEELTGERNGYDYFDDPADRARAVVRWKQWLQQHEPHPSTTQAAMGR